MDDGYRGESLCRELAFKLNFKVKQAFPKKDIDFLNIN